MAILDEEIRRLALDGRSYASLSKHSNIGTASLLPPQTTFSIFLFLWYMVAPMSPQCSIIQGIQSMHSECALHGKRFGVSLQQANGLSLHVYSSKS